MPKILYSNENQSSLYFKNIDYKYEYPNDLNLKPGSKLHEKIKKEVYKRASESAGFMSSRYSSWQKIDDTLVSYIDLDSSEHILKSEDHRKPVSIVYPYSYAILETLLGYFISAFCQEPIFRYEGVSPEDTIGAILLEKIIELHCNKFKILLNLHTMFRDSFAYGFGVVAPSWKKRYGKKIVKEEQFRIFSSNRIIKRFQDALIFEGNALSNIDPYLCLPNPNVSIDNAQEGEYFGWVDKDNYMDMLSEEQHSDGQIFNIKYLQQYKGRGTSIYNEDNSNRNRNTKISSIDSNISTVISNIHMYIKLIPREWELGESEYPEKWLFTLSADQIVTKAQPLGLGHGMFPIAIAAPDFDGYGISPVSRMETLYGLQHTLDWMFNCFDDQTEVLTPDGWKFMSDAKSQNSQVSTIVSQNILTFEDPMQWFEYDYDDYMLRFESKKYDLLVTPNHNLFGYHRYKGDWELKPAIMVAERCKSDEFKMIGNINWEGEESSADIFIQGVEPVRKQPGVKQRYEDLKIAPSVMAGFLGWFLSDGGVHLGKASGTYAITLTQSKRQHWAEIDKILENLPFHVTGYFEEARNAYHWTISHKIWFEWLVANCYKDGTIGKFKRVPKFIKKWKPFLLDIFFECFINGDGHRKPGYDNLIQIGVEGRLLADDLQEIAIKLGYNCSITESKTHSGNLFHYLNVNKNQISPTISYKYNIFKQYYQGKVYCFENSTHLTLVRRNGKVSVCGQSHVQNVRKVINDTLIVDPYLINVPDIENSREGGIIRTRRPAWGRGVKDSVIQLGVTDVTRGHVVDASIIREAMDKIGATDSWTMGALRSGGPERLTGKEFEGTRQGGFTRLERIAKIVGVQSMQDIGYMFAYHTQQFMSKDVSIKITGRWKERLMQEYGNATHLKVSPFDLLVDYDLKVRDGSIPGGNYSGVWENMFKLMSEHPELQQKFDLIRIFKHIIRNNGAKNTEEFIKVKQLPDEQVAQQVQSGNLVPTKEVGI